jgi:tetratricopeptide (TPR) repeat protein
MKRAGKMNTKAARQFSTLCLSGALTLGAFGEAQAAGNDAALQALFAQANYWHEKSHDELAMESLQKVLSVDANNAQALYLMALWAQQGGDLQAAAQWRARLEKAAPNSPACRIWITPKNGAGAAGAAQPGQTAGAQRQYAGRAGDLAQHVQRQRSAFPGWRRNTT